MFDDFRKPEYRQVVGSLGSTAMHTLLLLVNQIAQVGLLSGTKLSALIMLTCKITCAVTLHIELI